MNVIDSYTKNLIVLGAWATDLSIRDYVVSVY